MRKSTKLIFEEKETSSSRKVAYAVQTISVF